MKNQDNMQELLKSKEIEFKKTQQPYSQETTLEEAEKEFEKLINGKGLPTKQLLEVAEHYFIVGYELAKERSYSEEEFKIMVYNMVKALAHANNMTFNGAILNELFNKFKKE